MSSSLDVTTERQMLGPALPTTAEIGAMRAEADVLSRAADMIWREQHADDDVVGPEAARLMRYGRTRASLRLSTLAASLRELGWVAVDRGTPMP